MNNFQAKRKTFALSTQPQEPTAMTSNLTENRKADRETMAKAIEALAELHGATTERDEMGLDRTVYEGRRISVTITSARDVHVTVDFDGKSCQPDVYVFCWNTPLRGETISFSAAFDPLRHSVHGSRNKAQYVVYGWEDLHETIDRCLQMLNSGAAFDGIYARAYDACTARGEQPWQFNREP
jgi:hypothetical protein